MADHDRRVLVRAARVFDGRAVTATRDVLLDGPSIVALGAGSASDAETLDFPGCTILPGLVDTHVHLAFDASPDPVGALAQRDDDAVRAAMLAAARTAVRGGVTTMRDLGDRNYLSLDVRGREGLPTVLAAGPPITRPDGHCHYLGGAIGAGPDAMRAAVRERAERGVDVVKIMASGGTLTPGTFQHEPQFDVEELSAAVDEAHRLGLPVTAHAHAVAAIVNALDSGVDAIEHATFWTADSVDRSPDLLARVAASGVVLGATGATLPGGAPPPAVAARLALVVANYRTLLAAGARVVVGTDAGIGPPKPHDVVRHAMAQQCELMGVAPVDALRRVTADAAAALGLAASKGRLAAGYDADLLVVEGDPLTDPDALHRIRAVFARGVRVR